MYKLIHTVLNLNEAILERVNKHFMVRETLIILYIYNRKF